MENLLVPYQAVNEIAATRVLVLAPHPDDEVLGCGGTIMRHVALNIPVCVIVVSDGAYGVDDEQRSDYIILRQTESRNAAEILGYGSPVFWQYRDREICYGEKLVREISDEINKIGADLVYAPSIYEMHPDHRSLGMAALEAVRRTGQYINLALYEIGIPLPPNRLLNISSFAERKQQAMACFMSQNKKQRYDLDITALNQYRTYTLPPEITAAEAYLLVSTEELIGDPLRIYQSEHARQKSLGLPVVSNDLPLISVIVRSMDRPTLSEALDSVALQTYSNIEVIVVNAKENGHSNIGSWCGHFPMRLVGGGKPLSRSQAANAGLESAKGDYLIFLDDDDWFLPHHIYSLKAQFDRAHGAAAVYSAIKAIDEHRKEVRRFDDDFDAMQLRIDNFIPIHAVLFHRKVVDRGARFDITLTLCEDWDFWLQVLEYGTFHFVPEIGAVYRIEQGKGSGIWEDAEDIKKMVAAIYRKWMPHWTNETLWAMLESARCKKILDYRNKELTTYKEKTDELYHEVAKRDKTTNIQYQTIAARDDTIAQLYQTIAIRDQTTKELYQTIAIRDQTAKELYQTIAARDHTIESLNQEVASQDNVLKNLNQRLNDAENHINSLLTSASWKITRPLRFIGNLVKPKNLS